MQITASTISLTVDDAATSSRFFTTHFGFDERTASDGFAYVERKDLGLDIVFVQRRTNLPPEGHRDQHPAGLIITFIVRDIATHEARLRAAGVIFTVPPHLGRWGEHLLQVIDPNGINVHLVEWATRNTSLKVSAVTIDHQPPTRGAVFGGIPPGGTFQNCA